MYSLSASQVAQAVIPVGELCAGFAGPVNDTCAEGSQCCFVYSDYHVYVDAIACLPSASTYRSTLP
ncbi:hypothetical protein MD484_g552, partial [Candolleomyces efflorescens]